MCRILALQYSSSSSDSLGCFFPLLPVVAMAACDEMSQGNYLRILSLDMEQHGFCKVDIIMSKII
jgi:hypothetical protein